MDLRHDQEPTCMHSHERGIKRRTYRELTAFRQLLETNPSPHQSGGPAYPDGPTENTGPKRLGWAIVHHHSSRSRRRRKPTETGCTHMRVPSMPTNRGHRCLSLGPSLSFSYFEKQGWGHIGHVAYADFGRSCSNTVLALYEHLHQDLIPKLFIHRTYAPHKYPPCLASCGAWRVWRWRLKWSGRHEADDTCEMRQKHGNECTSTTSKRR